MKTPAPNPDKQIKHHMPANPKIFIKGTLVEISSRIEHGLPLVPNEITNKLIVNVLARAQTFYPVSIVNYVVMKNHFHTLIVVKDPADVPKFVEYFKRETSHFINRLLGKRQNTLWVKRYFKSGSTLLSYPNFGSIWKHLTFLPYLEAPYIFENSGSKPR